MFITFSGGYFIIPRNRHVLMRHLYLSAGQVLYYKKILLKLHHLICRGRDTHLAAVSLIIRSCIVSTY
jgi:hypothetical protein